jgi:hypothetical protein
MTRLDRRLARLPLKWLLLYVALIPAFAVWYVSLPPHSLRDANIESERSLENDAIGLLPELTAMARLPKAKVPTWTASGDKLSLLPGTLEATGLQHTGDGRLLIQLKGQYVASSHDGERWSGIFGQWLELSHEAKEVHRPRASKPFFGYEVAQAVGLGVPYASVSFSPPLPLLFPSAQEKHPLPRPGIGLFVVSPSVSRKLTRFYAAADGDPAYASGKWVRALYLSATTLTTLGLGDITAISNEGRIAIGIEAPAGIIVLGLFVNALARRRRAEDLMPVANHRKEST